MALCAANGTLEMHQAQEARNELGQRPPPAARRLAQIAEALNDATSCTMNLAPPGAEKVGTLDVLLGNDYLSKSQYESASREYEQAGDYYSRRQLPSLMWVEALRGDARAQLRAGKLQSADRAASKQTGLARSWVEKGFVGAALVDSLRFQAQVYDAEGKSKLASTLRAEPDRKQRDLHERNL